MGGGITGLAAAHHLEELNPDVEIDLFESDTRVGGVLQTEFSGGFLVEHSADMFTTRERAAIDLCERIGFADQLLETNRQHQRAFIAAGSKLVPVPRGLNLMTPSDLDAIRTTTLLSDDGKRRFLEEEKIPARTGDVDESLKAFAVRRFGKEAYEKIIQPLVGGIYTADPEKLSLQATLPQYHAMEKESVSIIAACRKAAGKGTSKEAKTSGARYNLFLAPRKGMGSLVEALANRLQRTSIRLDSRVTRVSCNVDGNIANWSLTSQGKVMGSYAAVIATSPASDVAGCLDSRYAGLKQRLSEIRTASSAIVIHGFDRKQVCHPLDGFGFVVPLSEQRKILASSFSSIKFSGRCPEADVLIRSFVGGGCQAELLEHPDDEINEMALKELQELIGVRQPSFSRLIRWNDSMPQYHLGHLTRVKQIEDEVNGIPGLELAGKWLRGVGIPACIESGENAATRCHDYLVSA